MGCLPSINWCRISQPSRVWCFSSTLNKHQHHSKRRRSASQTSKNYGYIWLHYHFSSMFFFFNDLLVLNFTYVGWLDGLLGVGWLIGQIDSSPVDHSKICPVKRPRFATSAAGLHPLASKGPNWGSGSLPGAVAYRGIPGKPLSLPIFAGKHGGNMVGTDRFFFLKTNGLQFF